MLLRQQIIIAIGYLALSPCFAQAQDPFAQQPPTSPAPAAPAEVAPLNAAPPGDDAHASPVTSIEIAGCDHVTSALCTKQNTSLLAIAGGYVVLCVLLAAVWRRSWNKRGTSTAGVRLLVPMLASAAAAGTLTAIDPARSADLECCLAHNVLRAEILLADSAAGRAVLFGALPAIGLYLIVALISGSMKR